MWAGTTRGNGTAGFRIRITGSTSRAIHGTNPPERLNAELKRRTNVVGIPPTDAAVTRPVGAMLLAQRDAWSLNRRYMQFEDL